MAKEENINCTVEALILASPEPVPVRKLSETIGKITPARIRQAVGDLNNIYMGYGSSFRIREISGGYQFHVLPDFEHLIKKMLTRERTVRLTRAALEALAIIAYKQPVTKIEIEHIRGVASDGVLHNLLQHKLILIGGRAETPGRPLLYKTSPEFLKFFGLNRISDLPRMEEIEEMIKQAEEPKEQTALLLEETNGAADMVVDTEEEVSEILESEPEDGFPGVSVAIDGEEEELAFESQSVDSVEETSREPESDLTTKIKESNIFGTDIEIESYDNKENKDSEKAVENDLSLKPDRLKEVMNLKNILDDYLPTDDEPIMAHVDENNDTDDGAADDGEDESNR